MSEPRPLEQLRHAMQIFANNGTVNLSVVRLREWIETIDQHIARAPLQNGGTAGDEVAMDAARYRELCRQMDAAHPISNEASTLRNILDDSVNLGAACMSIHLDAALAAVGSEGGK